MNEVNPRGVPDGLRVEPGTAAGFGFVFRAVCEAHETCRRVGMRWMLTSSDELHDHVYPAFDRHVRDMAECGELLHLEQDWGLDR